MTRPRIAMVLNAPGFGGVTEVVHQLLRHLPRTKMTPSLFFLKNEGDREAQLGRFASLGVEIAWARAGGGKIGVIAELAEWLSSRRIDLVHTHSYRPNLYGRMAAVLCRASGMRVVAHYHNHYDDKWRSDPAALPLERRLASCTDAMIAVSHSVRRHVAETLALTPDLIDVVHNGVDAVKFSGVDRACARRSLALADDTLAIGLVGRICEQKGQSDFVEAAVLLAPRLPRARFLLVGDIEDRALHAKLSERIDAAGLNDIVRFVGFRNDMPNVYAALDILAAPSRWEGLPLMLLEAMAAGVPIVASRIAPIEEAIGASSAAVLVPQRSPPDLADALSTLATDPIRRAKACSMGIVQARHFDWQATADRTAAVYRRVLDTSTESLGCG